MSPRKKANETLNGTQNDFKLLEFKNKLKIITRSSSDTFE